MGYTCPEHVFLHADHISKIYPGTKALDDVSFDLLKGKVNVLIGENGAGKSTLMKMIAGIEHASMFFNIVFFITILSLVIQGTTISWMAKLLHLATPLEKTGNDFGVEIPEEINTDLRDIILTEEMLAKGNRLMDMNLPKGTLVMLIKRGNEFMIPNGSLQLHAGDKLLIISENKEGTPPPLS